MTSDADGYLSHRQILVVMVGLMMGMFLAALDQSIVGTALPKITSDLGGFSKLSWVVTAYLLATTASTPLSGKISDLYLARLGRPQRVGHPRHRPAARGRVRAGGAPGQRADPADAAVRQLDLLGLQRLRLPGRDRHVRRDDLPPGLPPGGARHVTDAFGAGPGPDGGRDLHHLAVGRPGDEPHRPLSVFPPIGAALITVGLLLLSRVGWRRPTGTSRSLYLFGAGLGLCLRIVVVAVQNAVDRQDMGVATSSVAFFCQLGGSFGPHCSGPS